MAQRFVISFEEGNIKAVSALISGKNVVIQNAISFTDEEFDGFLEKERTDEFIVVCDFKTSYSDIIYIPVVKGRYLEKVIKSEISRKFPELKEFSFLYNLLGVRTIDGKKKNEVFVFAVNNSDIEKIIERFSRYNKVITYLVPSVFSLARTVPFSEEPVLCVSETGTEKKLFLLKNGKILFFRASQAIDKGISDFDPQDINMTINYCRQSLKLNPSQLLLIGSLCSKYEVNSIVSLPPACLNYNPKIRAARETVIEFIAAVSSIPVDKSVTAFLRQNSILTAGYKTFQRIKTALSYSSILFLFIVLFGGGYIAAKSFSVMETKNKIASLRSEINGMESSSHEYMNHKAEVQKLIPLVELTNRMNSTPDFQRALLALSHLTLTNILINSANLTGEGAALKLTIAGSVKEDSLAEMQMRYQNLVDSLLMTEGVIVSSKRIEINSKTFHIEATFKD